MSAIPLYIRWVPPIWSPLASVMHARCVIQLVFRSLAENENHHRLFSVIYSLNPPLFQDTNPPVIQERVGRCLVPHNPCSDQEPLLESCSVSIPKSIFNPKTNRNVRSFILTLEVSIPFVETMKKKKRKKTDAKPEQKRK